MDALFPLPLSPNGRPRRYAIPVFRVTLVHDRAIKIEDRPQIATAEDAYRILKDWFLDHDREEFVIVMLNTKNRVIGIHSVSIGNLSSSLVHPREVMKPLILHNAASVILAHNHPSGDPTPSEQDIELTRRLQECGNLFGIAVLDHLIIGEGRYYSFTDHGFLMKV